MVYQTNTGGSGVDELFSAPVLGGPVTQLNAPLPSGETVGFFEISADSSTVTYTTELINGLQFVGMNFLQRLYSASRSMVETPYNSHRLSPQAVVHP